MVRTENPNAQVHTVFPTPVYVANLGNNLTPEMLDYLNGQEFNEHNPGYGMISKNTFIMDDPIMQPLGDWVMKCMKGGIIFHTFHHPITQWLHNRIIHNKGIL